MELNPSWETANCAATPQLPISLWNAKVHYRIHKSPPLLPILNQVNPVHSTSSYLKSILMLFSHVLVFLVVSSSWLVHHYPICIPLPSHSCYMPRQSHPPWLDHYNYTWRIVQVMKLLTMQFSPTCHLVFLRSKYSPRRPVLRHRQPMFLPLCQRRSFAAIQTKGKNAVYFLIFKFSDSNTA
jgi:hypothetical protein